MGNRREPLVPPRSMVFYQTSMSWFESFDEQCMKRVTLSQEQKGDRIHLWVEFPTQMHVIHNSITYLSHKRHINGLDFVTIHIFIQFFLDLYYCFGSAFLPIPFTSCSAPIWIYDIDKLMNWSNYTKIAINSYKIQFLAKLYIKKICKNVLNPNK